MKNLRKKDCYLNENVQEDYISNKLKNIDASNKLKL